MSQDSKSVMAADPHVFVFAYGSNLCTPRMRWRVPSAKPLTTGYVPQRRFVLHKRGVDGSAKADAPRTGSPDDQIWGVVYRLHREQKPWLDQHESLGIGYDEEAVDVVHSAGVLQAWMYIARRDAIDASLLAYSWYHDLIVDGACRHGLPQPYVDFLRSFNTVTDPDAVRQQANRRHLGVPATPLEGCCQSDEFVR